MSTTLTLPMLVAGRDLADLFVDRLTVTPGAAVTVDARELVNGTSSFAAELVERILVGGQAGALCLIGGPPTFAQYVQDAAHRLQVADRLTVRPRLVSAAV